MHATSNHPDTLMVVRHLAVLYHGQGNVEEAEKTLKQALAGYKKALGPDHPDTLRVVRNLSILYHGWGNVEAAKKSTG